jgi:pimeloyl-ACP methyl ester carboxylesterase
MIDTQVITPPLPDKTGRERGPRTWTREEVPDTDITFRRRGGGQRAIVVVHGFLDDQHVWDPVIAGLTTPGMETVQLDLAGMGARYHANAPFTYERFAADVTAVVDTLRKPFVIVGHGMGAPIAELVAAARPERALGLVLLAPVPLAGTCLPDETIEPYRSLGWDPDAQRALRQRLSSALSDADLHRLVRVGVAVRPDVVRALADCWNAGLTDRAERSEFTGPVLILRGGDDRFITDRLISSAVSPRFASAETVGVDRAGHWPHLERPAVVAAQLDRFLAEHGTDRQGNTAREVRPGSSTEAFAKKSAAAFGQGRC